MATFQTKPVQIQAVQYTTELKKELSERAPSFDDIVPYHPDTKITLVFLAYFNRKTGVLQMPPYGPKRHQKGAPQDITIPIGGWMIYEEAGKSVRKYMTDSTFRELYQPL